MAHVADDERRVEQRRRLGEVRDVVGDVPTGRRLCPRELTAEAFPVLEDREGRCGLGVPQLHAHAEPEQGLAEGVPESCPFDVAQTERLRLEADPVLVVAGCPVVGDVRGDDPGHVRQPLGQDGRIALGGGDVLRQALELGARERRRHLLVPVVPTDGVDRVGPEVPAGQAPQLRDVLAERPQPACPVDDVRIVGDEQSAFTAGQDLAGVEAVAADRAKRPDLAAAIGGTVRLARVLDDVESVATGDLEDLVHVARHALDVDGDDRPGPRSDLGLDLAGIEGVGPRVDVDEDRDPQLLEDRLPRPGEGE